MQFDIATICDAATTGGGKINLLGSFDKIFVKDLPTVHSACSLAIKIREKSSKPFPKKFALKFLNEDDEEIQTGIEFEVSSSKKTHEKWSVGAFVFGILGLQLKKLGAYRIVIYADGKKVREIYFDVVNAD